jgi:plasmid stabilization system protein ParE
VKVRYTDTALAEIDEICSRIEQDNSIAVADIAAAIERTVAWIAPHRNWAPTVYEGRVQAKLVGRFQYRIYYISVRSIIQQCQLVIAIRDIVFVATFRKCL